MTKSFSIYLDFLRFFASFLVLLFHSTTIYNPQMAFFTFGHEAVIIFFILSGFVIAFVADTKETTLKHYAISRMARIYSVAIPAIIITAALDFSGYSFNPESYEIGYQAWDYSYIRVFSSLLFTNELWNASIQLFSNVPYWSLNYEVWYYVGFAVLTYIQGKKRWVLFAAICLFTGPKILLLMPLWWLGVYIYKSRRFNDISLPGSALLLSISILGIYFYIRYDIGDWGWDYLVNLMGVEAHKQLAFSRQFFTDYYLGLVIAAHFIAVRGICNHFVDIFNKIERPIRIIAGSTFTLYLTHQPLLHFFKSVFGQENITAGMYTVILMLTVTTTFLISLVTEQKKHVWKKWIVKIFDIIEANISRKYGTFKGLIRLIIANFLWYFGPYRKYGKVDFTKVKRLVFVCHGNICRSPFGHYLAEETIPEISATSIGLSTDTGINAYDMAIDVARDFEIDLTEHKATNITDFNIEDGDLFLVMEDRHITELKLFIKNRDVYIGLLGLWCRPRFGLLYDPHRLSREFFSTSYANIKEALLQIAKEITASKQKPQNSN